MKIIGKILLNQKNRMYYQHLKQRSF